MVENTHGKFSVGDEISIADVFLACGLGPLSRFQIDINQFPIINKIRAAIEELPEFQTSKPDAQPDAEQQPFNPDQHKPPQ